MNKDRVLEAIKNNPFESLENVSYEIRNDREFAMKLLEQSSSCYKYLSAELQNDRDFVLNVDRNYNKNNLLKIFTIYI